jgi:hypothetical protein
MVVFDGTQDEAYRLDPKQARHSFMKEAMDEMVNILTEDEFRGKLVVVLAGYTKEMHQMLSANEGLASRFPEDVVFPTFTVDDSLQLLCTLLQERSHRVSETDVIQNAQVRQAMAAIVASVSFASGRDVHTLVSRIEMDLAETEDDEEADATTTVTPSIVTRALAVFLRGIEVRAQNSHKHDHHGHHHHHHHSHALPQVELPHEFRLATEISLAAAKKSPEDGDEKKGEDDEMPPRDPGVDDATWERLCEAFRRRKAELAAQSGLEKNVGTLEEQLRQALVGGDGARITLAQAKLETARRHLIEVKQVEKKRKDVQQMLREMGRCSAGYEWIRDGDWWRCSAGGHVVSDADLDAYDR